MSLTLKLETAFEFDPSLAIVDLKEIKVNNQLQLQSHVAVIKLDFGDGGPSN